MSRPIVNGKHLKCWNVFPEFHAGRMIYLYALGLQDGRTKIGITRYPRGRMSSHSTKTRPLAWVHLFAPQPHSRAYAIERKACLFAERHSERLHPHIEWFKELSKKDAIAAVRDAEVVVLQRQAVRQALEQA